MGQPAAGDSAEVEITVDRAHRVTRVARLAALVACALAAGAALIASARAAEPLVAGETQTVTHAPLGLTVVATTLELPAGRWEAAAVTPPRGLEQVFVLGEPVPGELAMGRRVAAVQLERRIESARWRLQSFWGAIRDYASTHEGRGPGAFTDLDAKKFASILQNLDRSPWPGDDKAVTGPFYFLVPDVPVVRPAPRRPAPPAAAMPLVLELRPYVDDGKHWVLLSDGRTERRAVDRDLLARHGLTLTFARSTAEARGAPAVLRQTLLGIVRDPAPAAATVTLADAATGERREVRWSLAGMQAGPPALVGQWARARARSWGPLAARGGAPLLHAWAARARDVYGAPAPGAEDVGAPPREGRTTNAFDVLGGRAALQETLQLELLRAGRGAPEAPSVPLSELRGVEVKAHPFEQMLGGREGGRLPLADHVPADRLFVYFARPTALFPFLDKGGDFLFRAGGLFTRSAMDDDLKGRYLRRLGLADLVGRRFLESGEVVELALVTPDLFFLDGTDLTVLMRLRSGERFAGTLRALGFVTLPREGVVEKPLRGGGAAYWARQGDLVAVGTRRSELEAILALGGQAGAGSLGRSAEFRYMLAQLPVRKETRALLYLSDAFVRRMVSPAVKIAQLRRMRARAEMEMITGALLAALDGRRDKPSLDALARLGYVPRSVAAGAYTLQDDLVAVSPVWGRASDMAGLLAAPVESVTPSEAQAYRAFVDEYTGYWRQFFDPIGMRLDDAPGGALELTTFILPLPDSAIYNQVRDLVVTRRPGASGLRVPAVTPDPVLMLSLNLTEDAWVKIAGSWSELFSRFTGISPTIFDRLGPGIHVAIQDADPILALGNADIFGGFAGPAFTQDLMRHGLPIVLSALTRPCKVLIELPDAPAVLELLRRGTSGGPARARQMGVEFRQVEGRDAWIYALDMVGIAKIRLGIEVRDGYLILSNIPWSHPVTVRAAGTRPLNGAELTIVPGAVRAGLPGLYATQSEQGQLAALRSMGALYPLLLTGSATPEAAAARHVALFGSRPLHPGPGRWVWKDGRLESTAFGDAVRWRQPRYRPELGDFGLFEGVTRLAVNMQLEADGLRSTARWTWKGGRP